MHALFHEHIELVDYESLVHGEKMQIELEEFSDALDVALHDDAVEHDEKVEIIIHTVADVGTHEQLDALEIEKTVEHDDMDIHIMFFHDEIAFDDEDDEVVELEDFETDEHDDNEHLVEVHQMHGHIVEQMVEMVEILDCGDVDELVELDELEQHQVDDEKVEHDDVDIFEVHEVYEEQHEIIHMVVADDDIDEIEIVELYVDENDEIDDGQDDACHVDEMVEMQLQTYID